MIEGYRITHDLAEMDVDAIHAFISQSYWSKGIPKAILEKAINNSLCFCTNDYRLGNLCLSGRCLYFGWSPR